MACRTNADNIRIEPVYLNWDNQQVTSVVTVADVASSLAADYFLISSTTVDYAVWMDDGIVADPAPSGKTLIPVVYSPGASAATLAGLIATALEAHTAFHAKVDECDSTKVIIQNKVAGEALTASGAGTVGFTVATERVGATMSIGFIDGDVEVGLTEDILDVTSHQTGTQIIQGLRTGRNISNVTVSMKESDAVKLKAIIETSGSEFTPAGGTAVSAWGSEDTKSFGNITSVARKLILHPIRKSEGDLSEDWCFWRAYPILQGVVFSGENARVTNVEFKILPDSLLDAEARLFVYGDHTQSFL
jgi:hypothetical protein